MSDERKPITDEELDAIKGRLAAITEWPWIAFCEDAGGIKSEADAAFIANAPDDIARMLAEVERLREEVARLNKEADWLAESLDIITRFCAPEVINDLKYKSWREAARKAVEESA